MNRRYTLILLTLIQCVGCTHYDRVTLVTSTATLAWDWSQTRGAAEQGFSGNRREANPIMGEHPSAGQVDVYFISTILINTALWCVLPPKWRSVLPTGVTVVQTRQIYMNASGGGTGTFH